MRFLPLLLAALLGCDSGVTLDDVHLFTEVHAGHATLSLQNESAGVVGYNLCFVELFATRDLGTPLAYRSPTPVCTAELRGLLPGQTAGATVPLNESIGAGVYRFGTSVEVEGRHQRVWSNTFEVK